VMEMGYIAFVRPESLLAWGDWFRHFFPGNPPAPADPAPAAPTTNGPPAPGSPSSSTSSEQLAVSHSTLAPSTTGTGQPLPQPHPAG